MIASKLNKQITIERESTSINKVGTSEKTYVFFKECFAGLVPGGGNTQYNQYGELIFSTDDFMIRYDDGVNYKCRIIYNNNYYKIEHIENISRKQWMKLKTIVWERATII